jgi:hypothetical protein
VPEHEGEGPLSVVIWTTTPWTLPANQAVSLNPKYEYVIVQCEKDGQKERLVLVNQLWNDAVDPLKTYINSGRLLVFIFDFRFGESRTTISTPMHRFKAFVQMTFGIYFA